MNSVILCKATPIGNQVIEDVRIDFRKECPDFKDLSSAAHFYDLEADDIAERLIAVLPGGVLDRLTAKLLIHKASLLRISTRDEK